MEKQTFVVKADLSDLDDVYTEVMKIVDQAEKKSAIISAMAKYPDLIDVTFDGDTVLADGASASDGTVQQ